MVEEVTITIDCCKIPVPVRFEHWEAPALAPKHYRKNVTCPKCQKLVIVDLIKTGSDLKIEQEVIEK